MNYGHKPEVTALAAAPDGVHCCQAHPTQPLHPSWRAFLRFCAELQHGEVERLKIQDGLPVLAEVTKKKIKFGS